MIRFKLDAGMEDTNTVLGLCREPGCWFRTLANSKAEAYKLRDRHEEHSHMNRGRNTVNSR